MKKEQVSNRGNSYRKLYATHKCLLACVCVCEVAVLITIRFHHQAVVRAKALAEEISRAKLEQERAAEAKRAALVVLTSRLASFYRAFNPANEKKVNSE